MTMTQPTPHRVFITKAGQAQAETEISNRLSRELTEARAKVEAADAAVQAEIEVSTRLTAALAEAEAKLNAKAAPEPVPVGAKPAARKRSASSTGTRKGAAAKGDPETGKA
jgi:hypothetical protein